jgi:hypothetical protein
MPLHLHGFADFANYQLPEIGLFVIASEAKQSRAAIALTAVR